MTTRDTSLQLFDIHLGLRADFMLKALGCLFLLFVDLFYFLVVSLGQTCQHGFDQ
jgi:hypothetical protein